MLAVALGAWTALGAKDYPKALGRFPVRERQRADFAFKARISAGASIEAYPAYSNLLTVAACNWSVFPSGTAFPCIGARFYGADGKMLPAIWVTSGTALLWTTRMRDYRYSVIVPDGATTVELVASLREKGNAVEVKDVTCTLADPFASASRTTNPNLDYGLYNASGYSFMGSTRWRMTPDGRNWFDLMQGSCYPDPFPVKGGETIELRFRGDSPTWLHCYVCFYPAWKDVGNLNMNKKFFVLDVHNKRRRPERVERFDVPADATWARVYFQPLGEIHDFRVTAVGKESK